MRNKMMLYDKFETIFKKLNLAYYIGITRDEATIMFVPYMPKKKLLCTEDFIKLRRFNNEDLEENLISIIITNQKAGVYVIDTCDRFTTIQKNDIEAGYDIVYRNFDIINNNVIIRRRKSNVSYTI